MDRITSESDGAYTGTEVQDCVIVHLWSSPARDTGLDACSGQFRHAVATGNANSRLKPVLI